MSLLETKLKLKKTSIHFCFQTPLNQTKDDEIPETHVFKHLRKSSFSSNSLKMTMPYGKLFTNWVTWSEQKYRVSLFLYGSSNAVCK